MKNIYILLLSVLLTNCASESASVRYYLLHTAQQTNTVSSSQLEHPLAILKSVDIADYLRHSSMAMQMGQYEMYYSHQDVWAEELQPSFYKALLQDLNYTSPQSYLEDSSPMAAKAKKEIDVKLEHFHATDRSVVITSGKYWISEKVSNSNSNNAEPLLSRDFYYEIALEKDGYGHAVNQLRQSVAKLAEDIQQDIKALSNK